MWPCRMYVVSMIFRHRGAILMTVHLVGLKLICQVSSDFSSAVRSFWRSCLSWSFLITLKTALSSANSLEDDDLIISGRSLMKAKTGADRVLSLVERRKYVCSS